MLNQLLSEIQAIQHAWGYDVDSAVEFIKNSPENDYPPTVWSELRKFNRYAVYLISFDLYKGSFKTLEEATDHAEALGFECAIYYNGQHVRDVKPF